ncbi:MAG: substrate-binding domain-containing protein, partial [Lachnospiraceae bacterium]|nr:substrate-binding domain-containing protein [Lachnospiraceae bacterium]
ILLCSFLVIFYTMSEFVLFRHNRNLVSSADASYGFAYEGGYSSINLQPYYVDNEKNILAKLEESSDFIISNPADMPFLDGAEAAYPVYSAFANACYEDIAKIQDMAKNTNGKNATSIMPVQFSNTIRAYQKLLDGKIDIFFGAKPSEEQFQMAEDAGKELVLTPIGKEAFVFFVNEENPVDSLRSEQIRSIYSGEINKWSQVGGKNERILAFQRPENSGSQTMMEYFMGDIPLKEPLETEYESSMGGLVRTIAAYDNGTSSLGYSFRYYASIMINDVANANASESDSEGSSGIKFLAVDGVYPDTETIRSEEYPLTTQLYAITVRNAHPDGTYYEDIIEPFLEWMTGPQGQQLVADTGYVSLE